LGRRRYRNDIEKLGGWDMIKLFHGSDVSVENPKVETGRAKVDFGKGFYLSSLSDQAKS
jgi:hypothetical protein